MPHIPTTPEEALGALAEMAWRNGPVPANGDGTGSQGPGARQVQLGLGQAEYRTLIEQIPAVTFIASLVGGRNAMYVSPQIETLLGFTQEEWTSAPTLWWKQTHPDDRARVSSKFARTCFTGQPFRDVFRVFSKSGKTLWVDAEARLHRDEDGRIAYLQGIGFDVTEQVAARQQREELIRTQAAKAEAETARERVEEALRLRDEFFKIAAHELRTPVTSVLGQAQLASRRLKRGQIEPAKMAESLSVITHQATRLSHLITQLLDVSRLESGRLTIEPQLTDLIPLLSQVAAGAQMVSDRHRVQMKTPAVLEAEVDPLRFEQVATNLIENAIKYSPRGGDVEVSLRGDGDAVELSVRDHGVGIPPERRARIFERYYQAHEDHSARGLGLGLYISRQIVDLHGGEIHAEFPSDGGTRFIVRLPVRQPAPAEAAAEGTPSDLAGRSG